MPLTCPDTEELFSRRIDARLSSVEDLAFIEHLDACHSCADAYYRYETIFSAVSGVPELTTVAPAPMPADSTNFLKPVQRKPLVPRWISAAALVLLLTGVGKFAFDFGRKTPAVFGPDRFSSLAQVDPTSIEFPAESPGRRLRRFRENADNLYHLARVSKTRQADPNRMVRVFDDYISGSPLREDLRFLRDMDQVSLGSFRVPVRQFTDDVGRLLAQIDFEIKRSGRAQLRIRRIQQAIERSEVRRQSVRLQQVSRFYDFPEISEEQRVTLRGESQNRGFSGACISLSFGFFEDASRRLEGVVEGGDEGLREPAAFFSLFRGLSARIDIKGEQLKGFGDIFGGSKLKVIATPSATDGQLIIELENLGPDGPKRHLIRFGGRNRPQKRALRLRPLRQARSRRL
ncbi:MAG: zf-HC2 domain-containing protein [Planctomycetota bacterium]